jgi:RND family efflux transporter MFP subunit
MAIDRSEIDQLRIDRTRESQESPRRWWIWLLLAVVVAAGVIGAFSRTGRPAVRVAVAEELVSGAGTSAVLNATGYITARRAATVSSKVTGKVIDVLVEEGMEVREGQVLARLDPATTSQVLQLARAQADAAASALQETRVRIEEARIEERRASRLAGEQVASQSDLDRAQAQLRAFEARLAAQRDQLEVARREIRLREQDVSDTEIRAPFAGVVVSKNAQAGEMISPMSAGGFTRTGIATIVDMDSLEIEVDVNEAYINRVRPRQKVEAVLDAYPDWRVPAHVITVIPTADREKATVRVRIGIDTRDPRILPDMGVKVAFIDEGTGTAAQRVVAVPRQALRREGERDVVFVVSDEKLERRAVSVAGTEGDRARLATGVSPGERVVIEGPDELKDGQRVKVQEERK